MKNILSHLVSGQTLSREQAREAFESIMSGQSTPAQTAALLAMIETRGATVEELAGAAEVMRDKVAAVRVPDGLKVVDNCGAGGTGSKTFNISTAAAIVAAAAGRPQNVCVAKHGNRSVTSRSGSSQVLEALGMKLDVKPETLTKCLEETGFCFCFAPAHHPAMKHAGPVRADLGFRTMFNLLGPLTNPAGARAQVMGVPRRELTGAVAKVLESLGAEQAMVVHATLPDGSSMGELTTTGPTHVAHLRGGRIESYEVEPEPLGLYPTDISELEVDGPAKSAEIVEGVLTGREGPPRDIVLLNAAAALLVADLVSDLGTGIQLAARAIDNGDANRVLRGVVEITQMEK